VLSVIPIETWLCYDLAMTKRVDSMSAVTALYRYPVKGLSPEPLDSVTLDAGDGFPMDRRMAITNGSWIFDADAYSPRPKSQFLMLARHEALAALRTRVDPDGDTLTITTPDDRRIVARMGDDASLDALSGFLRDYLGGDIAGQPRLVRSDVHRFTDVSVVSPAMMSAVSLINLASVRDLERVMGCAVDPLRFRANIYFDGGRAWDEHDWIGREFTLDNLRLRVLKRTRRCPATCVDPASGIRDLNVPQALFDHFGHRDMGVYAEVLEGGKLSPGARMEFVHEVA